MAKKKRTDEISGFQEDWGGATTNTPPSATDENVLMPYSGAAIQKFIKDLLKKHDENKFGYQAPMEKIDGFYHIRNFADRESYEMWHGNPDEYQHLLLNDVTIPISDEQGVMNIVELSTATNQNNLVSIDGNVILKMRFTSQVFNPVTQSKTDTYEDGIISIYRRTSSTDSWRKLGELPIKSVPVESNDYTDVDISNLLNPGSCQIRVVVTGDQTQASTTYVVFQNVVKTSLTLQFRTEWHTPISGGFMPLLFTYTGDVAKTLNLRISGEGGIRNISTALGTRTYTETPAQFNFTDSESESVKILSHGIHEIEAWLSVDGVAGAESEHIFAQVMVVADSSDPTPYLILNNVAKSLTNWTSATLFNWAVYNPTGMSLPVRFALKSLDGAETYLAITEDNVQPGVVYTFSNMIEIENNATAFSAYMYFMSGGDELRERISLEIDNSQNFAPVSGADLIINPKLRSNTEHNPASIINTVTGENIPAKFTGFGFVSDGWVTDESGIRCLRVPSGRLVEIDYETLSDFIGGDQTNKTGSLTIEIDYAVRAITDEETPVVRMCSYTDKGNPLGFEIRPLDACFMTQNQVVRKNQDIGTYEGERTKVAVNLLYNLSNSGENYCRIFQNSIINREFNYPTRDVFVQYVDGKQTSQGIRIGGTEGADIDIYSLKVYKKALASEDVRQNYMASLDKSEDKLAYRDANDILSGGLISWDKAYDKYNVIKWIGRYPTYGNTKKDSFPGTLVIHQQGFPECSGIITGVSVTGQGTSSMLYFWWNGQWKYGTFAEWIDELGNVRGQGFQLRPWLPVSLKDVGKVNFASSMQSHKLGSTALYNDIVKAVCGGSSVTQTEGYENCRFAVAQEPFLFFVQDDENSEPRFCSFMTFGPGKGDKPTFGFDKKKFPDYVCIEGADNDRNLVMGRVPWIEEDVEIRDEENIYYNNEKSFSLVGGDINKLFYFQDAWNFVFQHYDNIDYFEGDAEDLNKATNANTSKHYWLTQAGSANAQYDLYRYDFINKIWVDAGISKTATGYSKVNINTQCGNIASGSNWSMINEKFKKIRTQLFKEGVGNYFSIKHTLTEMNFCKLIAASDNRGKNAYWFVDPITHLICNLQDDLDTIFPNDNVGQTNKPYDVEEHDLDEKGAPYWNSGSNSLYNQMENAFPDEQRANMKTILQEMAKLSDDGTVMGCFEKYFFRVQRYLPAVAYNEVARIVYERARTAFARGEYTNGTDPITQSCGDSLQREYQWIKRRIAYISSYAGYGEFECSDSVASAGSLNFRSLPKRDGTSCQYNFDIVPHISMYPSGALGSTWTFGEGNNQPIRLKAGQPYTLRVGSFDGNTNVFLNGINHMRTIGDFTNKSLNETFNLVGSRLTEFTVMGDTTVEFRPSKITVAAPLLQRLVVKNVETLEGGIDLSEEKKLREIDLRGTHFDSIMIPDTEYLTTLHLPATLRSLTLDKQPNLQEVTLEGASYMQRLSLGAGVPNSRNIFNLCFTGNAPLEYLRMLNVEWDDATLYMVNYLASITDSEVTGQIALPKNVANRPSFSNKVAWLKHWGNIDDVNNPLTISYYETQLAGASIVGEQFIYETGSHTYRVKPNSENANDVTDIRWELENNLYSRLVSQDVDTCVVQVNRLGDEDTVAPTAKLHCYITKKNGQEIHTEWEIGLYPRRAHLGDYVFYDGTYGPNKSGKTVVGVCFYINPLKPEDRRMVALKSLQSDHWGLFNQDNVNGVYGVKLPDEPTYDCYDIQTMLNITSTGLKNNIANNSPWYVSPDNYVDEESIDGFVEVANNTGAGDGIASRVYGRTGLTALTAEQAILTGYRIEGEEVPAGQANTLKIIQHRNHILEANGVDLQVPQAEDGKTELSVLNELIANIVAENGNKNAYRQFYYPAASLCYAYEPLVAETETLDPRFKSHNWYLPSSGELARLYWHSKQGGNYADDERLYNIFSRGISDGVFADFTASNHWASTDFNQLSAWSVGFGSGNFSSYYKFTTIVVRAVAAF